MWYNIYIYYLYLYIGIGIITTYQQTYSVTLNCGIDFYCNAMWLSNLVEN